jgi:hypothetical protein
MIIFITTPSTVYLAAIPVAQTSNIPTKYKYMLLFKVLFKIPLQFSTAHLFLYS